MPALPIHLRDLTHAEEGPDTLNKGDESEPVVNVSKMLRVSTVAYQILRYRQQKSNPVSARRAKHLEFLREVVFVDRDEEVLFELSEGIKPRPSGGVEVR